VVHVRMGNQDPKQAIVRIPETRHLRQQVLVRFHVIGRIKRKVHVEGDAPPLSLHLDAGAADLLRAPVNTDLHGSNRTPHFAGGHDMPTKFPPGLPADRFGPIPP